MAGKKIFIEYDIDSSDLKIANGETLSLTQQLRILKKELQKGDLKPEQFDILRKKIGDTEDQIAKTTVKSKDFFGVLSTLPGPVGQFGSSLLGVVDTLKVFSSFSFRDIKNSLSDVLDDVKEIGGNFLGFGDKVEQTSVQVDTFSNSLTNTAAQAGVIGGAVSSATKQVENLSEGISNSVLDLDLYLDTMGKLYKQGLDPLTDEFIDAETGAEKFVISLENAEGATFKLTEEQAKAVASGKALTVTTEGLVVAEKAATFWTTTLGVTIKSVLISTGIGIAIVVIGELISMIYKWVTSTEEADAANKALNETIKEQDRLLAVNLKAVDVATKQAVSRAKIAGKSEQEIFQIQKKGGEERLKELRDNDAKILKQIDEVSKNTILKQEDKNKTLDELQAKSLKSNQDIIDQINANEQARLDFEVTQADKRRANQKANDDKAIAANKQKNDKIAADNKIADEQLIALQQENAVLALKNERDRQDKELANQRTNEENKIKALEISEEKKNKLLEQVRLKFDAKQNDINLKRQEEDLKLLRDFVRKVEDIEIAAIEDKNKREDEQRQKNLQRDLEDLEEDKEFIKLSETAKEEVRKNIRQKYANEDKEIQKGRDKQEQDDRLKKLDDELRFLQIRQEAIRAGTKAFFDGQRDILAAAEAREIAAAEGKEREITAIKEKYTKLRKDLDNQEKMATLAAIGETIGAIGSLTAAIASSYDEEAKTSKAAFEKRKKLQIATATMSAASGIIQILAQPSTLPSPFDWIVKGVNAAALAIATAVQIKNIKNTQFEGGGGGERQAGTVRGMANGGIVRGPGGPKSDSVPTNLSNGEAVMTSGAVTMFAPLLSMMNQMGGGTSFSSDISVASSDNPNRTNPAMQSQSVIMKTYVVESELTSSQQKQARLKELSTL
jgi:hypothetical protein